MQKKPTIQQIQEYLKKYNPLDLSGASIELINEHNHLIYKLTDQNRVYCLRMINPESPRASDWITIPEEHTFLNLIDKVWLGPKSYFVDPERFILPLCIQEFVLDAVCFNNLKPLSQEYLEETAKAIAVLNSQQITPDSFPFRRGYTRYSYLTSIKKWRERLAVIEFPDRSIYGLKGIEAIVEWSKKIKDVINRAEKILIRFEPWLQKASPHFCLNFDGAHCGNTYWCPDRKCKVIFLDWEKVSFGDPTFTLVRFLTSIEPDGFINPTIKETLLNAYLAKIKKNDTPDFETLFKALFEQRLFERLVADFIWVIHNHVRENKPEPIEQTNAVQRYEAVMKLLEEYQTSI